MSYVLFDNFTGATIDTSKWTETDPNSCIAQNGTLTFTGNTANAALFANKLQSVASISSGVAVAQASLTWTTDSGNQVPAGLILYKDDSNFAQITSRDNVAGATYRLNIFSGGVQVYNLDDGSTTNKGKDVKIWTDGTTVKFYYWNGSAWTQMGSDQTFSLGYSLYAVISGQDNTGFDAAIPVTLDNAYLSNAEYSTQTPPAPVVVAGGNNLKGFFEV